MRLSKSWLIAFESRYFVAPAGNKKVHKEKSQYLVIKILLVEIILIIYTLVTY